MGWLSGILGEGDKKKPEGAGPVKATPPGRPLSQPMHPPLDASERAPAGAPQPAEAMEEPPAWQPKVKPVRFNPQAGVTAKEEEFLEDVQKKLNAQEIELPLLPRTHQKILEMIDNPKGTVKQICRELEFDPHLAALFLRIANSAYYRGTSEITNLEYALARIGLRQVKTHLLTLGMKSILMKDAKWQHVAEALWDHLRYAGVISRRLAGRSGLEAPEAFLAGFMHDLGKIAILKVGSDLARRADDPNAITDHTIIEACNRWHPWAGQRLAMVWKLPVMVADVARFHHEIMAPCKEGEGASRKLRAIASLANDMCYSLGCGVTDKTADITKNPGIPILRLEGMNFGTLKAECVEVLLAAEDY